MAESTRSLGAPPLGDWWSGAVAVEAQALPGYLLVAPYFGFAVISSISHYLGVMGMSLRQYVWLFVVLSASVPFLWLLLKRPKLYARLHWLSIVIAVVAYLLA